MLVSCSNAKDCFSVIVSKIEELCLAICPTPKFMGVGSEEHSSGSKCIYSSIWKHKVRFMTKQHTVGRCSYGCKVGVHLASYVGCTNLLPQL